MVYIGTVGLGIPDYHTTQEEVKQLVQHIFQKDNRKIEKLLPVFNNAKVSSRQFVVDQSWFLQKHHFADSNKLYFHHAINYSLQAIDDCLTNTHFLKEPIPYEAIDMIVFVSSTGVVTPSVDAYLLNMRDFREDIIRMPLWGLGCAGGAIGLSRGFEWTKQNPDKIALIICCEFCSLTFQKDDLSTSNLVGTAIFGDGTAATLLVGERSPYKKSLQKNKLKIKTTNSWTKKNSTEVMGWDVTNNGFEVIFSKRIPKLIRTLWKDHVLRFLLENKLSTSDLAMIIAHPGGRKVLEEIEKALSVDQKSLKYSYHVLNNHGNMSSATVIYVLKKWLQLGIIEGYKRKKGILCAVGPGFSSELLLLEWMG